MLLSIETFRAPYTSVNSVFKGRATINPHVLVNFGVFVVEPKWRIRDRLSHITGFGSSVFVGEDLYPSTTEGIALTFYLLKVVVLVGS